MSQIPDQQPIAAIATAPGRGGIGVIRLSGKDLSPIVHALFGQGLTPRQAHLRSFNDDDGQSIDEGIALYFAGPHSYTGEDVLELQGHGGPAVLKRVLTRCLQVGQDHGLRLAQPGEFTQRAFLNGKLDLAQAEAVADLIDASSEAAARSAMASLSGAFSQQVSAIDQDIVHLRMLVEATLDFPEEEIDFLEKYQARTRLDVIRHRLQDLIAQARQGLILREGLHVVLAGQPNVGKSSLLNALAGDDIAIVTPIAGTTRDRVVQQIHIDGVPLHIVDTAGLRETDDTVERIGIQRSWAEIEKANVILHLQDARQPDGPLDKDITSRLPAGTPVLKVYNKVDLLQVESNSVSDDNALLAQADNPPAPETRDVGSPAQSQPLQVPTETSQNPYANEDDAITLYISARTGSGLGPLRQALLNIAGWQPGAESPWLARERHLHALQKAQAHLDMADEHASHSDSVLDLFAEELRLAHEDLCGITGEFTSDDLLGEIFSSFCIGK